MIRFEQFSLRNYAFTHHGYLELWDSSEGESLNKINTQYTYIQSMFPEESQDAV